MADIVYLPEPVPVWESIKDSDGKNIIEKYYENQEKYAFSFQMMAYITRIQTIKKKIKEKKDVIIICERSIFTDKEIFAKMLYHDKKISEIDYSIYIRWFHEFITDIPISGIIYVTTTPEICDKRVKKRNRKGENIPLAYLENCHKYHENWLTYESVPVLTLNGNKNFSTKLPTTWLSIIQTFILELSPRGFSIKLFT